MASDTLDKTQLDIANQLLSAMDKLAEKADKISSAFKSQSDVMNDITNSFGNLNENVLNHTDGINLLNDALDDVYNKTESVSKQGGKFTKFVKEMQSGIEATGAWSWSTKKLIESVSDPIKKLGSSMKDLAMKSKVLRKVGKSLSNLAKGWKDFNAAWKQSNGALEKGILALKVVSDLTKSVMGGVMNMLKSAVSSIGSVVSGIVNIVKSAAGMVTKFLKLVVTLPFQIAQAGAALGGELRKELFEVVIQAGEETKKYFDSASSIGVAMKNLTKDGGRLLLEFQGTNSRLVKLFGYGAKGVATMISEAAEAVNQLGQFADLFGGAFDNAKNAEYFLSMQKGLGLSAEAFDYLALRAASSNRGLKEVLQETYDAVTFTSETMGIDRKRLSLNFQKLRTNIVSFGHLSSVELTNLTGKMTQMGVKMEDAAAVFSKFSTFEDAANASAMLSQTFGMNIDAMDLIQAKNPGEIFDMFRNAMFETGRSFSDLNRHEKDLMVQHTGMSAEGLQMIMNFRNAGYTYEEAKKKFESAKPEAKQIAAMKDLNTSITQIQKTLTFKSPFESYFAGLAKAIEYSPELRSIAMALSGSYEGIFNFAKSLKPEFYKGIITPILETVRTMKTVFASPEFQTGLVNILQGVSDFVSSIAGMPTSTEQVKWVDGFTAGIDSIKGKLKQENKDELVESYKKILKRNNFKSLLKKAGITKDEIKKLSVENTSDLLNKLKIFVDSNPKFKRAYHDLGKAVISNTKQITKGINLVNENNDPVSIVNSFTEKLQEVADKAKGSGSKVFKLGGKLMSVVIKGGALFGLALLKLVNMGVKFAGGAVSTEKGKKYNFLKDFLKLDPDEFEKIRKGYEDVLKDLFTSKKPGESSPFTKLSTFVISSLMSIVVKAFSHVGTAILSTINAVFGTEYRNPETIIASQSKTGRPMSTAKDIAYGLRLESDKVTGKNQIDVPQLTDAQKAAKNITGADIQLSKNIGLAHQLKGSPGKKGTSGLNLKDLEIVAQAGRYAIENYENQDRIEIAFNQLHAMKQGVDLFGEDLKRTKEVANLMKASKGESLETTNWYELFKGFKHSIKTSKYSNDYKNLLDSESGLISFIFDKKDVKLFYQNKPRGEELRTTLQEIVDTGNYNILEKLFKFPTRVDIIKNNLLNLAGAKTISMDKSKLKPYLPVKKEQTVNDGSRILSGMFRSLSSMGILNRNGETIPDAIYNVLGMSEEARSSVRALYSYAGFDAGEQETSLSSEELRGMISNITTFIEEIDDNINLDVTTDIDYANVTRAIKPYLSIFLDPFGSFNYNFDNSVLTSNVYRDPDELAVKLDLNKTKEVIIS